MKLKRVLIFFAIIIILVDLAYFYPRLTGEAAAYERVKVNLTRTIDGDTIETTLGKIRLLGINTPEKKQAYYEEAKNFLKQYEGKEIEIERTAEDKDKYGRLLRYAFYNGKFLNAEILRNGLANFYVYTEDKYTETLKKAEEEAQEQENGIWKKSKNYGCVEMLQLKHLEETRCNNEEQLILKNKCEKIDAVLKDDANHIYSLALEPGIFSMNFSCVFNDAGDSLFLSDENGLLLYHHY